VLAAHGGAFVMLQLAFQRGEALATAGTASLLTNALPIAAGLALFAERVPGGALGVIRIVSFGCVVVAASMLARRTEGESGKRPAPPQDRPDAKPLSVAASS
jgi:hypothetical protein